MSTDRIEQTIEIDAPMDRVWSLITEASELPAWWHSIGSASLDLKPGGKMLIRWKEHGITRGVIERIDAPTRFAFRWSTRDDQDPAPGSATLVEFTLEASGEGTRVQVVETGFDELEQSAEERAAAHAENVRGWREVSEWLRERSERQVA
jgi:uncharacterized protein YndB with AHSA1/START domain